jgi:acetolactate synthase small subunit
MQSPSLAPLRGQQQFLLDADTGVLCRVIGLYAARGITIEQMKYTSAGMDCMRLTVTARADDDAMRILVAKAASLFGVIDALL